MHATARKQLDEDHEGIIQLSHYQPKKAPMHFEFLPLMDQVDALQNIYGFTDEDVAGTREFIAERLGASPDVPQGADGWVVLPRSYQVADDYYSAATIARRKLHANAHLSYIDQVSGSPFEHSQTDRTRQCMAMLRYVQNRPSKLIVVSVSHKGERFRDCSVNELRDHFWQGEFGLTDFDLANILAVHPGRLECQQDLGLVAAGDRLGSDYAPSYCVKRVGTDRTLLRRAVASEEMHSGFAMATGFALPWEMMQGK